MVFDKIETCLTFAVIYNYKNEVTNRGRHGNFKLNPYSFQTCRNMDQSVETHHSSEILAGLNFMFQLCVLLYV